VLNQEEVRIGNHPSSGVDHLTRELPDPQVRLRAFTLIRIREAAAAPSEVDIQMIRRRTWVNINRD
jgi:hypothetical protein